MIGYMPTNQGFALDVLDEAIAYFDQKADADVVGDAYRGNVEMDLFTRLLALRDKLAGGGA